MSHILIRNSLSREQGLVKFNDPLFVASLHIVTGSLYEDFRYLVYSTANWCLAETQLGYEVSKFKNRFGSVFFRQTNNFA
jgi:hypothetical protein